MRRRQLVLPTQDAPPDAHRPKQTAQHQRNKEACSASASSFLVSQVGKKTVIKPGPGGGRAVETLQSQQAFNDDCARALALDGL